jgi:hypothetical protein
MAVYTWLSALAPPGCYTRRPTVKVYEEVASRAAPWGVVRSLVHTTAVTMATNTSPCTINATAKSIGRTLGKSRPPTAIVRNATIHTRTQIDDGDTVSKRTVGVN